MLSIASLQQLLQQPPRIARLQKLDRGYRFVWLRAEVHRNKEMSFKLYARIAGERDHADALMTRATPPKHRIRPGRTGRPALLEGIHAMRREYSKLRFVFSYRPQADLPRPESAARQLKFRHLLSAAIEIKSGSGWNVHISSQLQ